MNPAECTPPASCAPGPVINDASGSRSLRWVGRIGVAAQTFGGKYFSGGTRLVTPDGSVDLPRLSFGPGVQIAFGAAWPHAASNLGISIALSYDRTVHSAHGVTAQAAATLQGLSLEARGIVASGKVQPYGILGGGWGWFGSTSRMITDDPQALPSLSFSMSGPRCIAGIGMLFELTKTLAIDAQVDYRAHFYSYPGIEGSATAHGVFISLGAVMSW